MPNLFGTTSGIRTRITGVRGQRTNPYTMMAYFNYKLIITDFLEKSNRKIKYTIIKFLNNYIQKYDK